MPPSDPASHGSPISNSTPGGSCADTTRGSRRPLRHEVAVVTQDADVTDFASVEVIRV